MSIRPEFRWWILTLAAVVVLVVISLLAMDRPNVSWSQGIAHCPHCGVEVASGTSRCRTCREQYDWVVAPDEESPLSVWSLSALEADWVLERVEALGEDEAARRVATALALPVSVAERYLASVGRGRCGYCGGLGLDPASIQDEKGEPCPVCLGKKVCIACNGDRRVRVGDVGAERDLARYRAALLDVSDHLPIRVQRGEARRLNEAFVQRHAGTREAAWLVHWPVWTTDEVPSEGSTASSVYISRKRLDLVLAALAAE